VNLRTDISKQNILVKLARLMSLLVIIFGFGVVQAQNDTLVTAEAFRVVNVRSGPAVDNPVIGQLESGDVVNVVGRSNDESDWLQIEFDDQRGWVAFFVVTVTGDTTLLPIIENAEVEQDEATLAIEAPAELVIRSDVIATAYRRANVRSEPVTSAPVIAQLRPGDVVVVIARNSAESDWLQIDFDGQSGWVAYFLVSIEGDLESVPIVEANVLIEPTPTLEGSSVSLRTRYNANLRATPSLDADVVAVVPFGTTFSADTRTENGWLQVTYDGQTGWILRSLVAVLDNGNLNTLPLSN
jgi:N-acetylmuramoyl-L-alanine amidase